jgi:hypothetical protein
MTGVHRENTLARRGFEHSLLGGPRNGSVLRQLDVDSWNPAEVPRRRPDRRLGRRVRPARLWREQSIRKRHVVVRAVGVQRLAKCLTSQLCADRFRALPDADARKAALSKVDSWKRQDEFPKEFVTLPGETYPSSTLVDACYTLLVAPKSAELK